MTIIGNAEYFDNLNKEIKEKQNELSLSNSKVVAMKQMIANRDQEIEDLVRKSPMVREGSAMTLNKSDSGYTFCNFNFEWSYLSKSDQEIF